MNDIESRLADAMAARAQQVEPHDEDDALNRISERVNMNRRRGLTVLGIAAALLVAVGAVALLGGDDKKQNVNISTDSTNPSTTATSTPPSVIPSTGPTPIWPFESMNATYSTPEEAAKSFAVDYLGMTHARVDPAFEGVVNVYPNDRASLRTGVRVMEQPPRGWVVLSAAADMIEVDTPKPHDPLASSMTVSGRSLAFEAQLNVSLRPYGSTTAVFEDFTMGGGSEILPFSTTISPPATDQPLVLVLFEGDASGEGLMAQATVIPLDAAGSPEPTEFFGLTEADELVRLDFAGHVQAPLVEQVATFVHSPAAGLIAYSRLGEACEVEFISLDGDTVPASFAGTPLMFNQDGTSLTYIPCAGGDGRGLRNLATGEDDVAGDTLPANIDFDLAVVRGRFESIAFTDGTQISSYNVNTGAVVPLVVAAAKPISLAADASGRYLLWADENHDLWKWSGSEPVKVATGFKSAGW